MEIVLPYEKYQSARDHNSVELEGDFGKVVLCCEPGLTSVITSIHMALRTPVTLQVCFAAPEVSLRYWVKGNWDGRQGSYQLLYQPAGKWTMEAEPGEYTLICATAGKDLLSRLSERYNGIREAVQYLKAHHSSVHRQYASRIDARVRALLHKLGECDLTDVNRELFMEARMTDLMLQYLGYISSHQMGFCSRYHFTATDVDGIYQAKDMYDQTLDTPLSINALANSVNLHPRKLTEGLMLLFGAKFRQFRTRTRMEKAAELLQNTDKSIREISVETGYDSLCGFSRAFQAHFGCSALQFRK